MTDSPSPEDFASELETITATGVAAYHKELADAPTRSRELYDAAAATISRIQSTGQQAATSRQAHLTAAKDFEAQGAREQARLSSNAAAEVSTAAEAQVADLVDTAASLMTDLEATLKGSLVPPTPPTADRALAREELQLAVGPARGLDAAVKLLNLVTNGSDAVVAEAFSSYGEQLMAGPANGSSGEAPVEVFRRDAIRRLLERPENARRAVQLAGIPRQQGLVAAARQSARLRAKGGQ